MFVFEFLFKMMFYAQYGILGFPLLSIFFKTKCYYEDDSIKNEKLNEGFIFISNHRSFLDGLVIGLRYFPKIFHFISENFFQERFKWVKFIVRACGGIFIEKGLTDFQFIEESKKFLEKKQHIIIFPEGGFQYTDSPTKFYTGYIVLAIKTGAKIIPIVNDFNYGLFKRVHILIGKSIDLSEYANIELTREVRNEINAKIYDKFLALFELLKEKKHGSMI